MINHLFQWEWLSWWQNVPAYACNSKGPQWFACICALTIYGFAGLAVVHLSNPAVCICRQVISTLRLEHLPKQFVYFPTPVICICRHVIYPHVSEMVPWLISSLLINWNSFVQPIFTQPFLQSDGWWWIEISGDKWWWMKGWVIAGCLPKRNCIFQLKPNINQLLSRNPRGWALSGTFSCCSQRTQHLFFRPLPGIALLSSPAPVSSNLPNIDFLS